MSDVTAIDADEREEANSVVANGDNTIPLGNDEKIIESVARHMTAIMGELNLDLEDPNYEQTPERVA
jgi:hypothetical protein